VFDADEADVALVFSILMFVTAVLGPVTSRLVDLYGERVVVSTGGIFLALSMVSSSFVEEVWHLWFTFGLLSGIGQNLCFSTSMSIMNPWFTKNRVLAVGIGGSGTGWGQMAWQPFLKYLLSNYSWRTTFRILAPCLGLPVFAAGMVMRLPQSMVEKKKGMPTREGCALDCFWWEDPKFVKHTVCVCLGALGYFTVFPFIIPYSRVVAGPDSKTLVGLVLGFSTAIGRIACGAIADRIGVFPMFRISCFVGGLATFLLPFVAPSWDGYLYVHATVFGAFGGAFLSTWTPALAIMYGPLSVMSSFSLQLVTAGFGMVAGAPACGALVDLMGGREDTDAYLVVWLLCGTLLGISGPLSFILPRPFGILQEETPVQQCEKTKSKNLAILQ